MFKIARTSTITQKIINQIRTAILEGKLKPGDVLPPEKELMEQFGVSKQTLRESLRALEHMGMIDVRKGIGGGDISSDGKKMLYRARGKYGIMDIKPNQKAGKGADVSYQTLLFDFLLQVEGNVCCQGLAGCICRDD